MQQTKEIKCSLPVVAGSFSIQRDFLVTSVPQNSERKMEKKASVELLGPKIRLQHEKADLREKQARVTPTWHIFSISFFFNFSIFSS